MAISKIPMTKAGLESLLSEIESLKKESKEVIISIAEAREHGDLSENAEYAAARERQSIVEGRIITLNSTISRAEVIDSSTMDNCSIKFGATITVDAVLDSGSSNRYIYKIVGEYESDISSGLLSITSPLASALIGKAVGDFIEVDTPRGYVLYNIINIEFK